jgi:lipopolysaccharide/colanic/teichoic acid biosynthesis glycosyltransferase
MREYGDLLLQARDENAVGMAPGAQTSSVYTNYFKRVLDIMFVALTLPLVLPVMAVLYFIVRRDGGPFFYRHTRVGKDGVEFGCLKIRSMVVDAERKLRELIDQDADVREEWELHFKLSDDPRITPIGKLLRKTSLDELPQLFNILAGDMSVVGPRPITQEELAHYGEAKDSYVSVRPGLTGPWQISGRREADFESRALLDTEYAKSVSFFRDLYIVLMTVPEVLMARGR